MNYINHFEKENKILLVGDVHGNWNMLNKLIEALKPEVILQVGDFGWWSEYLETNPIKTDITRLYFCDGNHEDHLLLKKDPCPYPNLIYMKRGNVLTLLAMRHCVADRGLHLSKPFP